MDVTPLGLARSIVPAFRHILTTAVLGLFGKSPNASEQDYLTELIAAFLRPVLARPVSLLKSQRLLNMDWGVWGPMWVAKCTIPDPKDPMEDDGGPRVGVRAALLRAIIELSKDEYLCEMPETRDVEAEWTGYRRGVSQVAARPKMAECDQYKKMMEEVEKDAPTILYFHGGAFCLMDPATHRFTTSALAEKSGGRCFSVRYRLSPQNMFPAALLDALVSYLALLSPPLGSFHEAVPASRIVIAGDSSGACLASSLLLLLLTLRRMNITHIRFHGKDVDITGGNEILPTDRKPPVAGLAITSPWLDVSRALPSVYRNAKWDIIDPPSKLPHPPVPNFPADLIWPADPPRVETYCEARMVSHPLVSPLAAGSEDWRGAPPVHITVGWEAMQDEAEVFARRLHASGVAVDFEGYVGMPHCFAMVPWNAQGRLALKNWAIFCLSASLGYVRFTDFGVWINKHGTKKKVALDQLGQLGEEGLKPEELDDIISELLAKEKERRMKLEEKMRSGHSM